MDGALETVAGAIDNVNRILEIATVENLELAKKMIQVNAETALGSEVGKGGAADYSA
jgi:hypothetical protein